MLEIVQSILKWGVSQLPGAVLGAFALFLTGFKDEFFEKKKDARQEKRRLANEVLKITNEGIVSKYRVRPRDEEHKSSITIRLEGIRPKMAEALISYLNAWKLYTPYYKKSGATAKDDAEYDITQSKILIEKGGYLIKEAHKLKG